MFEIVLAIMLKKVSVTKSFLIIKNFINMSTISYGKNTDKFDITIIVFNKNF